MLPLVAMIAGAQYADYSIDPYQRNEFDYKDGPSISFPLKPEIVTTTRLLLAAWIMPTLIILTVTRFTNARRHAFHALFGLTESAALSYTMVVIGKKCAGSLRPCFKAMCGWDENLQACMGDYFAIRDARQSFPSGHAGAAAAGLGFLALFLNRELCAWASRNRVPHSFVRPVPLAAIVLAFLIAIARTITYHHRFEDIIAGLTIGAGCAVTSYFSLPVHLTSIEHNEDEKMPTIMRAAGREQASL